MVKKKDHLSTLQCKYKNNHSIGRPKYNVVIPNTNNQFEHYMGDDLASEKRGLYKLRYPISHGVVDYWEDMELLWKHAFSLLKVSPS